MIAERFVQIADFGHRANPDPYSKHDYADSLLDRPCAQEQRGLRCTISTYVEIYPSKLAVRSQRR